MTTVFVTLQDLETRHPAELITLAANEETGVREDDRIHRAAEDASAEIRTILKARYSSSDLARLDSESLDALKIFAIDIALYRIALAFARSNERIEERYKLATKRLEAIAAGKGGLSFEGGSVANDGSVSATSSPNEVLIDAPPRLFSRNRMRGL